MSFGQYGWLSSSSACVSDVLMLLLSRRCLLTGSECEYYKSTVTQVTDIFDSLWWPTHIEKSCIQWKETGKPPFPTLKIATSLGWHNMPLADLRYLYQTALAVSVLDLSGTSDMCLLLGEFRTYVVPLDRHTYADQPMQDVSARNCIRLCSSYASSGFCRTPCDTSQIT